MTSGSGVRGDPAETLRLTYERVCRERDRLRDARGSFARALGPAPASAGISTALVATFAHSRNNFLLGAAVACLAVLVLVGIVYGGLPAYRHLHAREIRELRNGLRDHFRSPAVGGRKPGSSQKEKSCIEDGLAVDDWLRAMIDLERRICGPEDDRNHFYPPWYDVATLQEGLDAERTGVWIVQALWVAVIVLLVLSVLV